MRSVFWMWSVSAPAVETSAKMSSERIIDKKLTHWNRRGSRRRPWLLSHFKPAMLSSRMKMKFCLLALLAPLAIQAQNLKEFEKKVTEFALPNGLRFLVVERHEAPVVSFNTHVKAGA